MKLLLYTLCLGLSSAPCFSAEAESPEPAAACNDTLLPTEIHYRLYGEGNPETIVMIHGLDSAGITFNIIAETLSSQYQVLVYDQRGHGRTPHRGTDYSLTTLANDLLGLVDHLGIQTFHLLGHSYGARTATRFTLRYPDRVKSLIIEDMDLKPRSRGPFEDTWNDHLELSQLPKTFATKEAFVETLSPVYGKEAESLYYRRTRRHEDGSVELLWRPEVSVLYDYFAATDPLAPELDRISNKPFLLIAADPIVGGSAVSFTGLFGMLRAFPDGDFTVVPGSSHNVHGSSPDGFLERLKKFLEKQR